MRRLILLALLLAAGEARADLAQCLDLTQSWTIPYAQGSVRTVTYVVPATLLIGTLTGRPDMLILNAVPVAVAGRFQPLVNADAMWGQIEPRYGKLLLAETGCPLLSEQGAYLLMSP